MKTSLELKVDGKEHLVLLEKAVDISIAVGNATEVKAYGIPSSKIETFKVDGFVGDVNKGGSCNVKTISFTPHGNGTHTECVGHISKEKQNAPDLLNDHLFLAQLITLPETDVISKELLAKFQLQNGVEALIVRTSPNSKEKLTKNYIGTEPCYFNTSAMNYLRERNINHLVVDLPSVDAETDPNLKSHHSFWNYPEEINSTKSITELVFIPSEIKDDIYLLNLMMPNMKSDALPSKPILYPLRLKV